MKNSNLISLFSICLLLSACASAPLEPPSFTVYPYQKEEGVMYVKVQDKQTYSFKSQIENREAETIEAWKVKATEVCEGANYAGDYEAKTNIIVVDTGYSPIIPGLKQAPFYDSVSTVDGYIKCQ